MHLRRLTVPEGLVFTEQIVDTLIIRWADDPRDPRRSNSLASVSTTIDADNYLQVLMLLKVREVKVMRDRRADILHVIRNKDAKIKRPGLQSQRQRN